MDNVALARINTFGPSPKADSVPPSEQTVSLSYGQLHDFIKEAVEQAIQPLQDRLEALDATIANQGEEIASLRSTVASLEKDRDILSENQFIQLKLINDLREQVNKKAPGKTETSRAEKIEKYLASRPDHKATFETLKGHLGIDNDLLGIAIKSLLPSGKYAIIKTPGDKRKRTLVMLPR
jgi:uncharacterized coiled-coil protein SlyX